ncbi:DUF6233 domain-containing protein [Streptomyces sp. NPDC057623]|uniref:DUF6233 domain-containing protein n=1 Tax=Streptomyces sp. NPDC057623 TaxID=3346187 RepID=UPI00367B7A52
MAALPPDPRRLRAILAFLEDRIAENETVGIYLRLQSDAVRAALAGTEELPRSPRARPEPPRRHRPTPSPDRGTDRRPSSFVVQQKRTPDGPEPALIHTTACTMTEGTAHPIRTHEARVALTDPNIEPCAFCRPDNELGILD